MDIEPLGGFKLSLLLSFYLTPSLTHVHALIHTNRDRERGKKALTFVRVGVVCVVEKLEELIFNFILLPDPSPELEFRLGVLQKSRWTNIQLQWTLVEIWCYFHF